MNRFNSIQNKDLGRIPAMVDIVSGDLYINPPVFDFLPKSWQLFILLHEEGHLVHHTHDEETAGRYAIEHFTERGGDPEDLRRILISLEKLSKRDAIRAQMEKNRQKQENPALAGFLSELIGIVLMASDIASEEEAKGDTERRNYWANLISGSGSTAQGYINSELEMDLRKRLWLVLIIFLVIILVIFIIYKTAT